MAVLIVVCMVLLPPALAGSDELASKQACARFVHEQLYGPNQSGTNTPSNGFYTTTTELLDACAGRVPMDTDSIRELRLLLTEMQGQLDGFDVETKVFDAPTCSIFNADVGKVCAQVSGTATPGYHPKCPVPTEPAKQTCWTFSGAASAHGPANIVSMSWSGPHMGGICQNQIEFCGDADTSHAIHDNDLGNLCFYWSVEATGGLLGGSDDMSYETGPDC